MNRKQISSRMRKIEEEYPVLLHNPKGFAAPVTVTVAFNYICSSIFILVNFCYC